MTQQLRSGVVGHRVVPVLVERMATGSRPGARTDKHRLALAIEGGGMRGSVSAGMAFALQELGLLNAFDAVYGASAGAISAAWLLSSRPQGLRGLADARFAKAVVRRRNLLRGRPMVDLKRLIEDVYLNQFPLDYASVLDNPIEFHPLATDVDTGEPVDLHSELTDVRALRLAVRASAALPVLAGGPVHLGGRRYYDAGLAESVPFRQALRDGATHVLVLRSKPQLDGDPVVRFGPTLGSRFVAGVALRRHSPQLRAAYLGRPARLADDDRLLAAYDVDTAASADSAVLSIRPDPSTPCLGRLQAHGALLQESFEHGLRAVDSWFAGLSGTDRYAMPLPDAA